MFNKLPDVCKLETPGWTTVVRNDQTQCTPSSPISALRRSLKIGPKSVQDRVATKVWAETESVLCACVGKRYTRRTGKKKHIK